MEEKNLWGNLENIEKVKTPIGILREQGALLTDATSGILEGTVTLKKSYETIYANLYIVAPALDNYSYEIVNLSYSPKQLYPVRVGSTFLDKYEECKSEETFCKVLEKILSSTEASKIIQSLISQCES